MKILLLVVLVLSVACSTKKNKEEGKLKAASCWNEERASFVLDKLTKVSNSMNGGKSLDVALVEETCRKRKYSIGDKYIVLLNEVGGEVNGKIVRKSDDPKACMDRALKDIEKLKSAVDDKIIGMHKQMYAKDWSDPDTSPVSWLNCGGDQNAFDDSVAILLHELTHGLKITEMQCVYHAVSQKYLCFRLPKELPLRSYGKLDNFSTDDENTIKALEIIQKIYLTDVDQPLYMLIDELNAYTLSNYNYHELFKKYGTKRFFDKEGKRPGIFLPLFYKITVNYLSKLQKDNKRLYMETFLVNTSNRTNMKELLLKVRETYLAWAKYLKARKQAEKPWERKLFDEAQAIEATLKL